MPDVEHERNLTTRSMCVEGKERKARAVGSF
jgi:hypothetical protein